MKSLLSFINENKRSDIYNKYIDKIENFNSKSADLEPFKECIWNILYDAYHDIGGLKGCQNLKDLFRRDRTVSIVRNSVNEILAVVVYRDTADGKKFMYCGASKKHSDGKIALQCIIIRDIDNLNLYHFGEFSGKIEHYFKKHGGYPIPNEYVPIIMKDEDIKLLDDGLHYERRVGGTDGDVLTKCMFGFPSEHIYKLITSNFLDYVGFRKVVNSETTLHESKAYSYPKNIYKAMQIIAFVDDCYEEGGLLELFSEMYDELVRCKRILTDYMATDKSVYSSIFICNKLLRDMPVVKLQSIRFWEQ